MTMKWRALLAALCIAPAALGHGGADAEALLRGVHLRYSRHSTGHIKLRREVSVAPEVRQRDLAAAGYDGRRIDSRTVFIADSLDYYFVYEGPTAEHYRLDMVNELKELAPLPANAKPFDVWERDYRKLYLYDKKQGYAALGIFSHEEKGTLARCTINSLDKSTLSYDMVPHPSPDISMLISSPLNAQVLKTGKSQGRPVVLHEGSGVAEIGVSPSNMCRYGGTVDLKNFDVSQSYVAWLDEAGTETYRSLQYFAEDYADIAGGRLPRRTATTTLSDSPAAREDNRQRRKNKDYGSLVFDAYLTRLEILSAEFDKPEIRAVASLAALEGQKVADYRGSDQHPTGFVFRQTITDAERKALYEATGQRAKKQEPRHFTLDWLHRYSATQWLRFAGMGVLGGAVAAWGLRRLRR